MDIDKFAGWDIEIADVLHPDADWKEHLPLKVSCAAIALDNEIVTWWGGSTHGKMNDYMHSTELIDMLAVMMRLHEEGYTIFTWNGLGFDFRVVYEAILAEVSKTPDYQIPSIKDFVLNHIDMMYQFLCVKGYPLALAKVSESLGLGGKTEGVSGALAPIMWSWDNPKLVEEGFRDYIDDFGLSLGERRLKVIEYVGHDALLTQQIAREAFKNGGWDWLSNSGRKNRFELSEGWLTVEKAGKIPAPDTSWMDNPWDRKDFNGWIFSPEE